MTDTDSPARAKRPAAPAQRLLAIDALRGFALWGIAMVNVWFFADSHFGSGYVNPALAAPTDRAIRAVVTYLFETKFYLLFSFLFGVSLTLQAGSAKRAGASFGARMARRHLGLFAIGALHCAVLYNGDILTTYALVGSVVLVLMATRWLTIQRAGRIGIGLVAAWGLAMIGLGLILYATYGHARSDFGGHDLLAAFRGSALDTLVFNASHAVESGLMIAFLQGVMACAMMLFGYAAGEAQLFVRIADLSPRALLATPWARRLLVIGLPLGLVGAAFYTYASNVATGEAIETIGYGVAQLTAPLLTTGYVVLLLALFATPFGAWIIGLLAPLGKVALSAYLGQSVLFGLVFTGYGFGLIDGVPAIGCLGIAIGIFAVQVTVAHWWLKRFRYGPVEWLLRWATNGTRPTWRRTVRSDTGNAPNPGIMTSWPAP